MNGLEVKRQIPQGQLDSQLTRPRYTLVKGKVVIAALNRVRAAAAVLLELEASASDFLEPALWVLVFGMPRNSLVEL